MGKPLTGSVLALSMLLASLPPTVYSRTIGPTLTVATGSPSVESQDLTDHAATPWILRVRQVAVEF